MFQFIKEMSGVEKKETDNTKNDCGCGCGINENNSLTDEKTKEELEKAANVDQK